MAVDWDEKHYFKQTNNIFFCASILLNLGDKIFSFENNEGFHYLIIAYLYFFSISSYLY